MRTKWLNKHVELSGVCCAVKEFFKERAFFTEEYSLKDGFRVVAFMSDDGSFPFATVEVHHEVAAIVVDYLPWGQSRRVSLTSFFAPVLTLFGGGILVARDLKKNELMEKIEKEFWDFLDGFFSELG
jgi:hypothetical protein